GTRFIAKLNHNIESQGTRFIVDNIGCSVMVAMGDPATMVAWFSSGDNDDGRSIGGGVLVEKLGVVLTDDNVWGARNRRRESLETRWRLKTEGSVGDDWCVGVITGDGDVTRVAHNRR
ncbi:hypothetical protein U1Q18_030997, partial [Sarracenia purpurea var. burkii]